MAAEKNERGNQLFRVVDRYVGAALLWLFGIFYKKRSLPTDIRKIAILKTAAIGDTVIISAAVADLQRKFPNAEIVFFAGNSNFAFAKTIPNIREAVLLPISNIFKSIRILRTESFDVLIDFGQWPRIDALLATFANAKFTIGFQTANQFRHYCYDVSVEHLATVHEVENCRRLIAPLGVKEFSEPQISRENLPKLTVEIKEKYVVFHMFPGGTKSYLKEWKLENWAAVAKHIIDKNYIVILSGTAIDLPKCEQLSAMVNHPNLQIAAGKYSLSEAMRLVADSKLLISVNTGIMHIGAALGTPLIALNGPTNPLRWGPRSTNATNITPQNPNCGYLNLGFEYPQNPPNCMESIAVSDVIAAVDTIIVK